jgi:GNAT superfamily N-acetyltransferase
MELKFIVGYDFQSFEEYYKTLESLHSYYKIINESDVVCGELGPDEHTIIMQNESHLIVWLANDEIIGHAVWHEISTDVGRDGDPRDDIDRDILRELFGGMKDNIVELHELWLRPVYRGKGYGQEFFEFFERYIREQGFQGILYYTDNLSAISLCRKRDYKESFLTYSQWHIFAKTFD